MAYRAKSCLTLTFLEVSLLRKLLQCPRARLAPQPELESPQIYSKELILHHLSGANSFHTAGFPPLSYTWTHTHEIFKVWFSVQYRKYSFRNPQHFLLKRNFPLRNDPVHRNIPEQHMYDMVPLCCNLFPKLLCFHHLY